MVPPGARSSIAGGEKANDVFAIHKVAILVEEETAVEVAVPCDAEVGLVDTYGFSGDRPVFRQQRVRDAIRERRIRVMVQADELQRCTGSAKHLSQGVEGWAGCAVAGVDENTQ